MNVQVELTPNAEAEAYLARLNLAQRLAVKHGTGGDEAAGPLLVIAGAGSGKTNTLAHRVAHLIAQGADPGTILLLTFSRRAADEMARRAERIVRQVAAGRSRATAMKLGWAAPSTASARACCANTPAGSASIRVLPSTTGKTRPT